MILSYNLFDDVRRCADENRTARASGALPTKRKGRDLMASVSPAAGPAAGEVRAHAGGYRYVVAGFLAVVYTLNFMDRQIMSILQEPIRKEFGLSDAQLGLLTGLAFVLFYTSFGIPVGWLGDRFRRTPIVAAACAIWSFFTVACGFAQTFVQLVVARLLVGAGEAGGTPPSYSIISDYFPPRARGVG